MLDTDAMKQLTGLRERDHAQVLQLIADARKLCVKASFARAAQTLRELSRLMVRHTDAEERAIDALVEAGRCSRLTARRFTDAHVALRVLVHETEAVVSGENRASATNALENLWKAIEAHEADELRELLPLLFSSFELSERREFSVN